ncbi:MAG TPA: Yip1 family protein [Verrucomicrobiae bacterium]|nr:Yip1 family protein [Verrucomicrobiae bacterium]
MIESVLLIFNSNGAWERIVRAERGILLILFRFLLPLLLLTCAIEGYGLMRWGKHQGPISRPRTYTLGEAVVFESGQMVTSLALVVVGAGLLKSMGATFHTRNTYQQAFTVVAYALSPFFLLRVLDAFSVISPVVTWAIGIVLALAALYHGVPQVMQPDPPQAFGLYFMTAMLLFFITGLMGFVAAWYLQGKFSKLDALISSLGARLF